MRCALFLGRFQPPHRGHIQAIRTAADQYDAVLVAVGSAQVSYAQKNPFTAGERIEMIEAALSEAGVDNARAYPLADINRHAQWVAYVDSQVPPYHAVITNNPLTRILFADAGYEVQEADLLRPDEISGTRIRRLLAQGKDISELVPPAVATILDRLGATTRIQTLAEDPEHAG